MSKRLNNFSRQEIVDEINARIIEVFDGGGYIKPISENTSSTVLEKIYPLLLNEKICYTGSVNDSFQKTNEPIESIDIDTLVVKLHKILEDAK